MAGNNSCLSPNICSQEHFWAGQPAISKALLAFDGGHRGEGRGKDAPQAAVHGEPHVPAERWRAADWLAKAGALCSERCNCMSRGHLLCIYYTRALVLSIGAHCITVQQPGTSPGCLFGCQRRVDLSQVLPSCKDVSPQDAGHDDASHLRNRLRCASGQSGGAAGGREVGVQTCTSPMFQLFVWKTSSPLDRPRSAAQRQPAPATGPGSLRSPARAEGRREGRREGRKESK